MTLRIKRTGCIAIGVILLLCGLCGNAIAATIHGVVRDSLTNEPVPYAAVRMLSNGYGKLSDEAGRFDVWTNRLSDTLVVSAMGFTTKKVPVKASTSRMDVFLVPDGLQLDEVVIRPKKEKYSKKNNPAVDFVTKIRNSQQLTDPRRNDYYNYDKYQRMTIALNNFNPESEKNLILKKFPFLKNYVDTSEVSGLPKLNVSVREKASTVHYRRDPHAEKEYVTGVRQNGLDDLLDEESMRALYEDVFNDIDLYDNDISLLHNEFVSPLSRIAPDFYKFYLTDTVSVSDTPCVQLTFVPRNSQTLGFVGHVYVPVGDTTMFIKKVEMGVPADINLNYIDRIMINQEFERAPDGSRLLVRDDLIAEISILPGTQGLYFRRNTAYANHDFNPVASGNVYSPLGNKIMAADAESHDDEFWRAKRLIDISRQEENVGNLVGSLRDAPFYFWSEKILRIFAVGYIGTGKNSKFDFGPVTSVFSHNDLEGYRFRVGGMTTTDLSSRWFANGYVAYGTKDHKWKYKGQLQYSFNDKKDNPDEFPVHAIKVSHSYDVDMLGQDFAFANADNMFMSLKRQDDFQITYLRSSKIEYKLELENHLSFSASLDFLRQEATEYMPFVTGYGRRFGHYNEALFSFSIRYAPGERIFQTRRKRSSLSKEKPVFMLTHRYAPKGFLGSMFEVNATELSISKRFWFSAFGCLDAIVKGGHVWSRSPYPNLLIPNANLSYIIQPETYALMNPMEFINDSYASWELTYWANGAIFNYIPYVKKLKLREVFSFRGLFGHLSKRNDPTYNDQTFKFPEMAHTQKMGRMPYMEASVGVDNIFTILRVDYVWRLSYRNLPNVDKSGVRLTMHLTF